MTTAPTKNPAELMAELTDQVRLLRLDVTNLTATAVSQDEATELRTHLHQTLRETNANALKILQGAEAMAIEARTHSVEAARDAAQRAVSGLSGEIRDAGNALRREALKSRCSIRVGFWPSLVDSWLWGPFWALWRSSGCKGAPMLARSVNIPASFANPQAGKS